MAISMSSMLRRQGCKGEDDFYLKNDLGPCMMQEFLADQVVVYNLRKVVNLIKRNVSHNSNLFLIILLHKISPNFKCFPKFAVLQYREFLILQYLYWILWEVWPSHSLCVPHWFCFNSPITFNNWLLFKFCYCSIMCYNNFQAYGNNFTI